MDIKVQTKMADAISDGFYYFYDYCAYDLIDEHLSLVVNYRRGRKGDTTVRVLSVTGVKEGFDTSPAEAAFARRLIDFLNENKIVQTGRFTLKTRPGGAQITFEEITK